MSDKEHFDKMLLKELAWKLDREVWAHVQNPSPSEEWSTSKAREETRKLCAEYLGNLDEVKAQLSSKEQELREEKYKVRNLLELLEQTEAELDAKADKEQEFEELKRINSEYKQLLNPILDWGQTEGLEHGLKLGESITTTVLNRAKEYNQLRAERDELKENYEGLKGHCKVLTEINVANESFDNSKLFRERHGIKEGDSFCEWFLNHKTKEFKSELDSSRKRCEDLEAILDNNGLSWTYKNLSQ